MSELLRQAQSHINSGNYSIAEECCKKAMKIHSARPAARKLLADALYNQGVMYALYGEMITAEAYFLEALENNKIHVPALHNLGIFCERKGRLYDALWFYSKALNIDPISIPLLRNITTVYTLIDRPQAADETLKKLCEVDPANAGLYKLRRGMLTHTIVPNLDYPNLARVKIEELLNECLSAPPRMVLSPEAFAIPYFYLSYHGQSNRDIHTNIARAYLHLCPSLAWEAPRLPKSGSSNGDRIKIGIASAHLFDHSIGHTSRGFVEQLDRTKFEVVVIRLGSSRIDPIAQAIDAAADSVVVIQNSLSQAREQIASLALDILFYQDIGMEPLGYFLSFARLAPVQITTFGHPDTTGIPNMDYFISSDLYELPSSQEHYSERLITVPNAGTLSYYHRPTATLPPGKRTDYGFLDTDHLYLCPQTLFKIHPSMDAIFEQITRLDSNAQIVLIEPPATHLKDALVTRLEVLPVEVYKKIRFIKRMLHAEYMQFIACADVMLDTVHFNGQNTNLEAFSLGVPVVTWPGSMQRERHTYGMYKAMGLPTFSDMIVDSTEQYAHIAVKLATNASYRQSISDKILKCCPTLYQNDEFIANCETLFEQLVGDKLPLRGSIYP